MIEIGGEMSKVIFIKVLIGISGSGKSTYARKLAKDYNEEICSTDKYVEEQQKNIFLNSTSVNDTSPLLVYFLNPFFRVYLNSVNRH